MAPLEVDARHYHYLCQVCIERLGQVYRLRSILLVPIVLAVLLLLWMLVDYLYVRLATEWNRWDSLDSLLLPSLLGEAVRLHKLGDGVSVLEAVLGCARDVCLFVNRRGFCPAHRVPANLKRQTSILGRSPIRL